MRPGSEKPWRRGSEAQIAPTGTVDGGKLFCPPFSCRLPGGFRGETLSGCLNHAGLGVFWRTRASPLFGVFLEICLALQRGIQTNESEKASDQNPGDPIMKIPSNELQNTQCKNYAAAEIDDPWNRFPHVVSFP